MSLSPQVESLLKAHAELSAVNAKLLNQIQFFETAQAALIEQRDALTAEVATLKAQLNTPELHDFSAGVVSEAQHQRARWGSDHDAGKEPHDWFWLLGYLAGKALKAATSGDIEKAKHHTISSAACLANWHASLSGQTNMRPGIDPAERGIEVVKCSTCNDDPDWTGTRDDQIQCPACGGPKS